MGNIGTWLVSLAGPFIRKILVSLGIGVVSYAGLRLIAEQVRDRVTEALGGLSGAAYEVVAMTGAFEAVGIILGGLMARATLMAIERIGRLTSPGT